MKYQYDNPKVNISIQNTMYSKYNDPYWKDDGYVQIIPESSISNFLRNGFEEYYSKAIKHGPLCIKLHQAPAFINVKGDTMNSENKKIVENLFQEFKTLNAVELFFITQFTRVYTKTYMNEERSIHFFGNSTAVNRYIRNANIFIWGRLESDFNYRLNRSFSFNDSSNQERNNKINYFRINKHVMEYILWKYNIRDNKGNQVSPNWYDQSDNNLNETQESQNNDNIFNQNRPKNNPSNNRILDPKQLSNIKIKEIDMTDSNIKNQDKIEDDAEVETEKHREEESAD